MNHGLKHVLPARLIMWALLPFVRLWLCRLSIYCWQQDLRAPFTAVNESNKVTS